MKYKKSQLKEVGSYYYEQNDWYKNCPDELPYIPDTKVEIFPNAMTHREILETYKIKPYASYAEAAAALVPLIADLKYPSRIVYFEEDGKLYRLFAWRYDDGLLGVHAEGVDLRRECDAESGVCFSN